VEEKPILKNRQIIIILAIALIALLVVYYFLGMDYRKQRQARDVLAARVNEAALTLAQTPEPPQALEQRLAEAEASLAAVQYTFPSDLNSTRVINDILLLADECQVKAIPLATQPWSIEDTGRDYQVFRIDMSVSGSYPLVTDFVSQLESASFAAIAVENLGVTRLPVGGNMPVVCNLDLAIYTRFTTSG
jgi:Tfp pilus assembly protein PilO